MPATRRLILIILILLFLLLFLTVPGVSWSQTPPNPWQDPARELAKRIVALTGPGQTVALAIRNISSLTDAEVAAVRLALEAEFRVAGLRLAAKPNGAPELRVTLSENLQGLLWVAEVFRDDARDVAMISLPKPSVPAPNATTQMFVLQSKLIWEQDDPILDFALTDLPSGATPSLLVLEPVRVVLYRSQRGGWQLQQSAEIPGAGPWSRDLRGRLLLSRTSFRAYVPGVECQGGAPQSLTLACSKNEGSWELQASEDLFLDADLVTARNFFVAPDDDREPESKRTPFFTAGGVAPRGERSWIQTGVDGRARLYSDRGELLASFAGWGSELASIETDCGSRWQVLVSHPGDWTDPDTLQAFEITGHEAVAVSAPVNLPGPVTALWTTTEGNTAHAVVHNLKTGSYEAYTLTLSCGR